MTDKELCRAVDAKRRTLGLSLRALETVLGVSFSTLARLARGTGAPSLHTRACMLAWLWGDDISALKRPERPGLSAAQRREVEAIVEARLARVIGTGLPQGRN